MKDSLIDSSRLDFASFFQRLMAGISDWLILNLLSLLSLYFLASATSRTQLFTYLILLITLVIIPASVFNIFYYVWFISQQGSTPGKSIWGVKIVADDSGENLSFTAAFMREAIMKRVSAFFFGLGFWWFWKSSDRQTWHDLLIGSYALNMRTPTITSWILFTILVAINGILVAMLLAKIPVLIGLFF
ncbi:MAG TPA: RDD family protein [Candidatus Woesebacteria bacterium]|nr:RDD family protein [Candidatus Woesebacteria bacterium]